MRLDYFWVGEYKNLKDVSVDFEQDQWVTVVIGWNGTGKSNVLEALALLFRDFVLGVNQHRQKRCPSFRYKLRYECRGQWIHIDADPARKKPYRIHKKPASEIGITGDEPQQLPELSNEGAAEVDHGEEIAIHQFFRDQKDYLPQYIFGYYSGTSDRMAEVFRDYLVKYDGLLRAGKDPGLRRLFYALPIHSQFVLLAFILQQDDLVREFLHNQLGLDKDGGIESVLFVLRQPPWKSKAEDGDPRFWNARGVVKDFLARLYDIALAPIRVRRLTATTLWNNKRLDYLYLYVKDLDSLKALVAKSTPREFFRDVESTHVSELIEEVRIRVKLRQNDGSVVFRELSEGEQQLLTVLGLLRFTAEEESLFLLDEPDTHLNPRWSADYLQYLQQFAGDVNSEQGSSHIVLTTHNPLAVAELMRDQVQILKRDSEDLSISVQPPEEDPRGMGYAGIVTSDMFGLAAALDGHTLRLLEERRTITLKEEALNDQERTRLAEINRVLEPYGFRHEARDPIFREYLRARAEFDRDEGEHKLSEMPPEEQLQIAKVLIKKAIEKADADGVG